MVLSQTVLPAIPMTFTIAPPNNFCDIGVRPMEKPFQSCGTCKGRCNTLRSFLVFSTPPRYCTCDTKCIAYGDCCADFETECPKEYAAGAALREQFVHHSVLCDVISTVTNSGGSTISNIGVIPSFPEYTFINGCGRTGEVCNRTRESDLLQPNLAIPVTDVATGLNYINFQCAKCNGVQNIIFWTPQLACDIAKFPEQNPSFVIQSQEDLRLYLPKCAVNYMVPKDVEPRYACQPIQRKCPMSCKNKALVDKCEKSFVADYVTGSLHSRYDNYYCAVCNGEELSTLKCPEIRKFLTAGAGRGVAQFSLSLLFDFDPSDGLVVGQYQRRAPCPRYQARVGRTGKCRQVTCPQNERFVDGDCLSRNLTVTFISAAIFFNKSEDVETAIEWFTLGSFSQLIERRLNMNIQHHLGLNTSDNKEVELEVVQNISRVGIHEVNLTMNAILKFGPNSTFNHGSDIQAVTANISDFANDEIILGLQRLALDLALVEIVIDGKLTFEQVSLNDCTWFLFQTGEFNVTNSTLTIRSTSNIYSREQYRLIEHTALVCVRNEEMTGLDLDISPALGIVTIVFMSLSIILLLVRIVLQFKIRYYQSFAAKLQFNLCLSLCLAFITLLLGGVVALYNVSPLCITFGVLMYWFFMAAFFWMTAIAVDTWLVFRPSSQFVKVEDKGKSLSRYAVPCWLFSAIIASIVIGLDYSNIDMKFQAKFGANLCWFNQRYALLIYLGIPVAVTMLLTLVLFILIVVHLRRTIQSSIRPSGDKESHQVSIYLRLFALMGVSWIIGFVAAFADHDSIWFVFIILNASQGILIFISFVIRRPVLKEIRSKIKESSSTTSQSTTSSSLFSSSNHGNKSQQQKATESSTM